MTVIAEVLGELAEMVRGAPVAEVLHVLNDTLGSRR